MMALSDPAHYQATAHLSPAEFSEVADVNRDGVVNNLDVQALITLIANKQAGGGAFATSANPEDDDALIPTSTLANDSPANVPASGATTDAMNGDLLTNSLPGIGDPTAAAAPTVTAAHVDNTASNVTTIVPSQTVALTPGASVQVASADVVPATGLPQQPSVEAAVEEPTVAAASNIASGTLASASLPVVPKQQAAAHELTIDQSQPDFDVTLRSMPFNLPSTPSNVTRVPGTPEPSSMAFLSRIDRLFSTNDADLLPMRLGTIDSPQTVDVDEHFSELDWIAGP